MLKQNHCLAAVKAPPRRLELRSSAPEADTLSTELRGRATEFYHQANDFGSLRLQPTLLPVGQVAQVLRAIFR